MPQAVAFRPSAIRQVVYEERGQATLQSIVDDHEDLAQPEAEYVAQLPFEDSAPSPGSRFDEELRTPFGDDPQADFPELENDLPEPEEPEPEERGDGT